MGLSSTKALRGLELGTRAGYLVLAGFGVFLLWRIFGPKKTQGSIQEVVPILPPIGPAGAGDAPEPRNTAPPQGIAGGSLLSGVTAAIIDPSKDGRADRRALSSNFPATIEVVNVTRDVQSVQVEIVADFYEFAGGERRGIRTRFPARMVPGDHVERFEVLVDSGNFNGLTFEFGQATAVVQVYTNGVLTQSTSFEVW